MAKVPGEQGGRRKVGTDQGSPTAGTKGGTRGRPQAGDVNRNNLSSGAVSQPKPVGGRASRLRVIADIVTGRHRRTK
jgi:hypothetical protein